MMDWIEIFLISFAGSFLGGFLAVVVTLWLHRKQMEQMEKLKISIKHQVRKLKPDK